MPSTPEDLRTTKKREEEQARSVIEPQISDLSESLWRSLDECDELGSELWQLRVERDDDQLRAVTDCFLWAMHLLVAGWHSLEAGYFVSAIRHTRGILEGMEEGLAAAISQERAGYWIRHGANHTQARRVVVNQHYRQQRGRAAATHVGDQLDLLYTWGSEWDHVHPILERHMMTPPEDSGPRRAYWGPVPDDRAASGIAQQYVAIAAALRNAMSESVTLLER